MTPSRCVGFAAFLFSPRGGWRPKGGAATQKNVNQSEWSMISERRNSWEGELRLGERSNRNGWRKVLLVGVFSAGRAGSIGLK